MMTNSRVRTTAISDYYHREDFYALHNVPQESFRETCNASILEPFCTLRAALLAMREQAMHRPLSLLCINSGEEEERSREYNDTDTMLFALWRV
jgi:hypothetical protein